MSNAIKIILAVLAAVIVTLLISQCANITRAVNTWRFGVQQAHTQTDWQTLRTVEDTARSIIATWEADRLMWEQFRHSEIREERNWANAAMMRANRAATYFNEFMRRNSFVWAYGIPRDIDRSLEILR